MIILISLGVGIITGALWSVLGLPIPAPSTVAGVAGVVGVTAGFLITKILL